MEPKNKNIGIRLTDVFKEDMPAILNLINQVREVYPVLQEISTIWLISEINNYKNIYGISNYSSISYLDLFNKQEPGLVEKADNRSRLERSISQHPKQQLHKSTFSNSHISPANSHNDCSSNHSSEDCLSDIDMCLELCVCIIALRIWNNQTYMLVSSSNIIHVICEYLEDNTSLTISDVSCPKHMENMYNCLKVFQELTISSIAQSIIVSGRDISLLLETGVVKEEEINSYFDLHHTNRTSIVEKSLKIYSQQHDFRYYNCNQFGLLIRQCLTSTK